MRNYWNDRDSRKNGSWSTLSLDNTNTRASRRPWNHCSSRAASSNSNLRHSPAGQSSSNCAQRCEWVEISARLLSGHQRGWSKFRRDTISFLRADQRGGQAYWVPGCRRGTDQSPHLPAKFELEDRWGDNPHSNRWHLWNQRLSNENTKSIFTL